jgi:hypothetical protein
LTSFAPQRGLATKFHGPTKCDALQRKSRVII